MFHDEFFPTNEETLHLMQLDVEGKTVLDPSAGSGSILDYAAKCLAKRTLAIEITDELRQIVKQKHELIGKDWFDTKEEDISYIDSIVMNPPFSNADKHILHAWKIAPEGCEIVAICNYNTLLNDFSRTRRELESVIKNYGFSQNLGSTFSDAERQTDVEIGLIKLFKPITSSSFAFDNYFLEEDEIKEKEDNPEGEGIQKFDEVKALVNRYVGCMKQFDTLKQVTDSINYQLKQIQSSTIDLQLSSNERIMTKESFSKSIQKASWSHIFRKMNIEKYVTSGVMKDVNKYVEIQSNFPFTMKNIYKMFDVIIGTREQTYNKALEEAIDNFTKHTHENRYEVEGWKTNLGYMLNKKFIVENMLGGSWSKFAIGFDTYSGRKLNDLTKVLCNLTGRNYSNLLEEEKEIDGVKKTIYHSGDIHNLNTIFDLQPSVWYDYGFFEIKLFKKGTGHFKFKNIDDWYLINQAYGKLKGFTLREK